MKEKCSGRGTVIFEGGREQFLHAISKSDGTLISHNRFDLVIENTKMSPRSRLAFRFRCRFEEMDGGYQIRYIAVPTWRPLLVSLILLSLMLLSVIACVGGEAHFGIVLALALANGLYAAAFFAQRLYCLKCFREIFQKQGSICEDR